MAASAILDADIYVSNKYRIGQALELETRWSLLRARRKLTSSLYILSRIRLLGRFTTCLAQTTTASRLLFALGWHFMPRECDFKKNFLYHCDDVIIQ